MSKKEFLEVLSQRLSEELPRNKVISNLQYYESYIDGAMKAGQSEQAVMDDLGDPNMIARTILDTQTGEAYNGAQYADDATYTQTETKDAPDSQTYGTESNTGYTQNNTQNAYETHQVYEERYSTGNVPSIIANHGCLILSIILILVVIAVVALIGSVISFLWPILVPVLIILLVVSLFRDNRR